MKSRIDAVSQPAWLIATAILAGTIALSLRHAPAPVGDPCVVTCVGNVTVTNDPNQCGAVVNYGAPTTTGECGTVTCTPPSGSFFPVGQTTVTCQDSGGASCTFTVTVVDTQAPTVTCTANVTAVASTQGGSTKVVNFAPPTAADNCPGVVASCTPPSGSTFPAGTTTVTCTATDASQNTASCNFTVTVFSVFLQDDSSPSRILLWNASTGEYRFYCNGIVFTGRGVATRQGNILTLVHNAPDRRLQASIDLSVKRGNAALQSPPGQIMCTILDRKTDDNVLPPGI